MKLNKKIFALLAISMCFQHLLIGSFSDYDMSWSDDDGKGLSRLLALSPDDLEIVLHKYEESNRDALAALDSIAPVTLPAEILSLPATPELLSERKETRASSQVTSRLSAPKKAQGKKRKKEVAKKRKHGWHCLVGDCTSVFKEKSKLKRHLTSHTGERAFKCLCGKGSGQRVALLGHLKRHVRKGQYTQELVDKHYATQTDESVKMPATDWVFGFIIGEQGKKKGNRRKFCPKAVRSLCTDGVLKSDLLPKTLQSYSGS